MGLGLGFGLGPIRLDLFFGGGEGVYFGFRFSWG